MALMYLFWLKGVEFLPIRLSRYHQCDIGAFWLDELLYLGHFVLVDIT